MSPQHLSRLSQRGVRLSLLLSTTLIMCATTLVFTARSRAQEREFRNTVPAHVPVKVKLKNEQKFKKLDNAEWARDLEVEVKNTGAKPIYFLYMVVVMPEMTNEYGHALAFQFHYGRKALVSWGAEVSPEDVPIQPGESITLKVSETQLKGFEAGRHLEKTDKPKKVEFDLQLINYGDRTGYQGKDGTPMSFPKERGQNPLDSKPGASACGPPTVRAASTSDKPFKATYSLMPASLTRAIFFPAIALSSADAEPAARDLCGCQNRSDCSWGVIG